MKRQVDVERVTRETEIKLCLGLDGGGESDVRTGIGFFDHMLSSFARHGAFDLTVRAEGDLEVDAHHTVEDVGLVMGEALRECLGRKTGINRFGSAHVPMDEALVRAVVDLSGRPFLGYRVDCGGTVVGGVRTDLYREFFQAVANVAGMTLHVDVLRGGEAHHVIEAVFKAFARALAQAIRIDAESNDVPSTKGTLS